MSTLTQDKKEGGMTVINVMVLLYTVLSHYTQKIHGVVHGVVQIYCILSYDSCQSS